MSSLEYPGSEMKHDNKNKTIYYDNVIIKIYDIPILYLQNFHILILVLKEDLGFYLLLFSDEKHGQNIVIPYFFNISKDKILL